MGIFRNHIRAAHRQFDGWVGQFWYKDTPLLQISSDEQIKMKPENFHFWGYSRIDHFNNFNIMPIHGNQTISTCDLKVYQDLFIYTFILNNLPQGSRILEVGGGESRIISSLNDKYEFWNLDKLEGEGHGPKRKLIPNDYRLIREYIGSFSNQLPDNYFDLVFSISVVEHFPTEEYHLSNIINDLNRLLNKSAYSLHCVDALLFNDYISLHPMVIKTQMEITNVITETNYEKITNDQNLWVLPKYSYYTRWFPITHKGLRNFGRPISINILWQNT